MFRSKQDPFLSAAMVFNLVGQAKQDIIVAGEIALVLPKHSV